MVTVKGEILGEGWRRRRKVGRSMGRSKASEAITTVLLKRRPSWAHVHANSKFKGLKDSNVLHC